jgi:hypothetical protein
VDHITNETSLITSCHVIPVGTGIDRFLVVGHRSGIPYNKFYLNVFYPTDIIPFNPDRYSNPNLQAKNLREREMTRDL